MIPTIHLTEMPEPPCYMPDEHGPWAYYCACEFCKTHGRTQVDTVPGRYMGIVSDETSDIGQDGPSASYRMF